MRSLATKLLTLIVLLVPVVACGGSETPPAEPQAAAPAPAANPPAASAPPPATASSGGPAPVTSRTPESSSEITAPGAVFSLPAAWVSQAPSSSMRLAQASIPGPAGEGQLTVFYFGPGGGGGVDANISRWIGQMELTPNTAPRRETFEAGDFRVTWVEVEGTLKPSTMGVGPTVAQPGSRMLGAVVEGAQGPWFFKATGPSETLDAAREAFLSMLRSVRAS